MRVIAVLMIVFIAGCGPSTYQLAKADLANQYAGLDQINDLGLRQQRFFEIQQREIMLEAQEMNTRQVGAQIFSAWAISQAIQNQPVQPTPVFNYFGWSK